MKELDFNATANNILKWGVIAGIAYLAWQWWSGFKDTGCLPFDAACLSRRAGEATGEYVGDVWRDIQIEWSRYTSNYELEYVPPTPAGYLPSNVTWDIGGGVKLGLPAGYTPESWCAGYPYSPFCSDLGLV